MAIYKVGNYKIEFPGEHGNSGGWIIPLRNARHQRSQSFIIYRPFSVAYDAPYEVGKQVRDKVIWLSSRRYKKLEKEYHKVVYHTKPKSHNHSLALQAREKQLCNQIEEIMKIDYKGEY